jgi:hypothetical protein
MMKGIGVRCQHCGASLTLSQGIRYVTCGYCHSELEIIADADSIHTEVLKRIEQRTTELSERMKRMELQNEIDRLDQEWLQWRERNLSRDPQGQVIIPDAPGAPVSWMTALKVGGGFAAGLGLVILIMGGAWYIYVGIVTLATVSYWWFHQPTRAQLMYHRASFGYEMKRQSLSAELLEAMHQPP